MYQVYALLCVTVLNASAEAGAEATNMTGPPLAMPFIPPLYHGKTNVDYYVSE
jgi:hypothetical protein